MQNSSEKFVALNSFVLCLGLLIGNPAMAAEPVTDRERNAEPPAPELPAFLRQGASRPATAPAESAPLKPSKPTKPAVAESAPDAPARAAAPALPAPPPAPPVAAEPPSEDTATILSTPTAATPTEPEAAPLPEGLRVYYAPTATSLAENELAAVELLTRMASMGGQYAFQIFLNTPAQGDDRVANLRQFELQRVLKNLGVSANQVRFAYAPFFKQGSDEAAPLDSHYAELRLIEQN